MSHNESSATSSLIDESWVSWFCGLNGNHFLCEVDRAFMEDSFNLFGIKTYITKDFTKVLNTILDKIDPDDAENEDLSRSAALLYGLIHSRYILTIGGLSQMEKKFSRREFGECPRTYCKGQAMLPVGLTDEPKIAALKLFCPKCRDVYNCQPSQRHIDGAYFGTTFPHFFLMTYEGLVPEKPKHKYTPRLFGFKVHETSCSVSKDPRVDSSRSNGKEKPVPKSDSDTLQHHDKHLDSRMAQLQSSRRGRQGTSVSTGAAGGGDNDNDPMGGPGAGSTLIVDAELDKIYNGLFPGAGVATGDQQQQVEEVGSGRKRRRDCTEIPAVVSNRAYFLPGPPDQLNQLGEEKEGDGGPAERGSGGYQEGRSRSEGGKRGRIS